MSGPIGSSASLSRISTVQTFDFQNMVLIPPGGGLPDAELPTREKLQQLGLLFKMGEHELLPMASANMQFLGVKLWFELTTYFKKLDLPLPPIFFKKTLSDNQLELLADKIVENGLDCSNVILTTGVDEVLGDPDKNRLNIFKLISGLEASVNKKWQERHGVDPNFVFHGGIQFDTPNGYCANTPSAIRAIKERLPKIPLIAGVVATVEGVESILNAGADFIKFGIGPGGSCTTRLVPGVGVPQISAIAECSRKFPGTLISEGGMRDPLGLTEAIAAGAVASQLGTITGGTSGAGEFGEIRQYFNKDGSPWLGQLDENGNPAPGQTTAYVEVFGSASARGQYRAPRLYRAKNGEGITSLIPYSGSSGDLYLSFVVELVRYAADGRAALVAQHDYLAQPAENDNFDTDKIVIDQLLIIPQFSDNPDHAALSRGQVAISTTLEAHDGTASLAASPVILRPENNAESIINAMKAASRFATEITKQLDLLSTEQEMPAGVVISADLADEDVKAVVSAYSTLDRKPLLHVEFSAANMDVCDRAAMLLEQAQVVMLSPGTASETAKAITKLRAMSGVEKLVALTVTNESEYAQAQISGADIIVLRASDEALNMKLLTQKSLTKPVLFDGLTDKRVPACGSKVLVLGAQGYMLSISNPTSSEADVFDTLQDFLAGLRSAATFVGHQRGEDLVTSLQRARLCVAERPVHHPGLHREGISNPQPLVA